jgi:hypothetical protein
LMSNVKLMKTSITTTAEFSCDLHKKRARLARSGTKTIARHHLQRLQTKRSRENITAVSRKASSASQLPVSRNVARGMIAQLMERRGNMRQNSDEQARAANPRCQCPSGPTPNAKPGNVVRVKVSSRPEAVGSHYSVVDQAPKRDQPLPTTALAGAQRWVRR